MILSTEKANPDRSDGHLTFHMSQDRLTFYRHPAMEETTCVLNNRCRMQPSITRPR